MSRIFITGDTHGDFDFLSDFCTRQQTTTDDILIITGDTGILFFGPKHTRTRLKKEIISQCPITILAVRGNHDDRPEHHDMHLRLHPQIQGWCYWEDQYPNILYAQDGGLYEMNGSTFLTIGGAYSVDKDYRLMQHLTWYADEELSNEEMRMLLRTGGEGGYPLRGGYSFDYIITHTCPLDREPYWMFMSSVDQSKVSKRMEIFLQKVDNSVRHKAWFFGHYHGFNEYILDESEPRSYYNPSYVMLYNEIAQIENSDENLSYADGDPLMLV